MTLEQIIEERKAMSAEIDTATAERLTEIEARTAELLTIEEELKTADETEKRSAIEIAEKRKAMAEKLNTIEARKTDEIGGKKEMDEINVIETQEYRSAYLKTLMGKDLNEAEKRALTTASGSAGAAVPTTTLNLIVDKLRQSSVLYPRISVFNIPGNVNLAVANAKNDAAWKEEGTDGTPADDTVASVSLAGLELIKLVEISAAAKAMTIPAFEQYIVAEIGRKMAIAIENAILNGRGAATYFEPVGIVAGGTWGAGNSIQYTTLGYDNIVDGLALLPTMYHQNAVFVMSRKTAFGGLRKIKDTAGQPLFTYNPQDRAAWTILGYPVILDDYIADDVIILGDLGYYYMNFSQPIEIAMDGSVGFKSGKTVYRGLAVVDGKPALAEAFIKIYK